jgi:small subunit ribosomal protein S6
VKRDYELGFILPPEVNEEQTRAILDRVEQIVTNYDGQIVKVNQWGRRRLAYPINHHRDGYYVFVDMILTPETVAELDRTLKVSEEVLRHLIKRRDPKAVQKERQEREEREARAAAAQSQAPTQPAPEIEAPALPAPEEVEGLLPAISSTEGEPAAPAVEEAEAVEAPVALSEEESDYAPPALEEEGVEA